MSHYADEQYDVYEEPMRTAAKDHVCGACGLTIGKGQRYAAVRWVFDKSAGGVKRCIRCQAMHEYLRGLGADMWPDEKLNCGEEFEQHWGYKPPEWLQELAFWQPGERLPAREPCTWWERWGYGRDDATACRLFYRYQMHGRCQRWDNRESHQEPCS